MPRKRILVTGGSGFIGANFISEACRLSNHDVMAIDIAEPKYKCDHVSYRSCDILNKEALQHSFHEFQPEAVVHFAGRTDMFGSTVADYAANHVGTENVVSAIQDTPSVEKAVFTSSQFVVGPGRMPTRDEDYSPHTIYGESKVLSERAVRQARLDCSWTIIRPTNIWGQWHPRYPTEFWRVLKQGRYFHPGGGEVMRCYGYVGNVVDQVLTILTRERDDLDRKTFYVGDKPIDLYAWTNAFSLQLTGRPVRVVPRAFLWALAKLGDVIVRSGGKFPIYTSRFHSMTESYLTPMEPTFAALGPPPISLEQGVQATVAWLRAQDAFWS